MPPLESIYRLCWNVWGIIAGECYVLFLMSTFVLEAFYHVLGFSNCVCCAMFFMSFIVLESFFAKNQGMGIALRKEP